ncbi:MAG: hypothetical protein WBG18_09255, partial [Xanthobacteraceae bacterium]
AKTAGGTPAAIVTVGGRAELRVRPTVQGAALVLENKTDASWQWPAASPISRASWTGLRKLSASPARR